MIGKIKSIDILGRCFKTSTNLSLFPKESEGKSRDRISVVYGKMVAEKVPSLRESMLPQ